MVSVTPIKLDENVYNESISIRWLKPIFQIGLQREINENDIYAVTNSKRSDRNTEIFAKQWQLELEKEKPSIVRVVMAVHGFKVITMAILHPTAGTFSR